MQTQESENAPTLWHVVILLFSLLVLGALTVDAVAPLPKEASRVLQVVDTLVCFIFLGDFVLRFKAAPNKIAFLKWGWIDLVASIPNIDILRWGRLARVLRIIRILRAVRSFQKILALVFQNRVRAGIGAVAATCFLLVTFSSVSILVCEQGVDANIKTAEDAIWWSITTITTVGYGDKFPTTLEGRIVAAVLMVAGIGVVGILSGVVAAKLLGKSESSGDTEKILQAISTLQTEVKELRDRSEVSSNRISGVLETNDEIVRKI